MMVSVSVTDFIATPMWQCFADEVMTLINVVFLFRHSFVMWCMCSLCCVNVLCLQFLCAVVYNIFTVSVVSVARQSSNKKLTCFIEC